MTLRIKNALGFLGVYLLVSLLFGLLQALILLILDLKVVSKETAKWEPEACLLGLGVLIVVYLGLVIFNRKNRIWYAALPFSISLVYLLVDTRLSTSFSAISSIAKVETQTYAVIALLVVSFVVMLSSLQRRTP